MESNALQAETPEVTTSHRPWFKKGDKLDWNELETYDRTWPTVPHIGKISSFFRGSFDLTLLIHGGLILALAFFVLLT